MKCWFENLGIKTSLASSKLFYFTPFHNSTILNPWLFTKQRRNHLTSNCFYTKTDDFLPDFVKMNRSGNSFDQNIQLLIKTSMIPSLITKTYSFKDILKQNSTLD